MIEQISLLFLDWKGFKVTVIFNDVLKLKTFCKMYLDRSQEDKLPLMLQHVFIFIYKDSTI